MMRYNQYQGATAGTNGSGIAGQPTLESLDVAIATLTTHAPDEEGWQETVDAFAAQHGVDLKTTGVMMVPFNFDMTLIPPAYRGTKVRTSTAVVGQIQFIRNPTGGL